MTPTLPTMQLGGYSTQRPYPPSFLSVEQLGILHFAEEIHFYDSVLGEGNGAEYKLVSGDFLKWKPTKIMD